MMSDFKITESAAARGRHDITGFMDIFDASLDVLDGIEKGMAFENAKLFISMLKIKFK